MNLYRCPSGLAAVSVVCASSFEGVGWYWMEWVWPKTPITTSPPAESSLGNQAGLKLDLPREVTLGFIEL